MTAQTKPAQQAIRTLAAGEQREPADPDVHFWLSLRSWRQHLSPAPAGSDFFYSGFPRLAALARGYYSVALRAQYTRYSRELD